MEIESILGDKIREGKTKIVFKHKDDETRALMAMKDVATAGDGVRKEVIPGKALATWEIASRMMDFLLMHGHETAYISSPAPGYMLIKKLDMAPLEIVGRKIATGSLVNKLAPIPDGTLLKKPTVQVYLKDDERHDPELSVDIYDALFKYGNLELRNISGPLPDIKTINQFKRKTKEITELFYNFFLEQNLKFYDIKLEIGQQRTDWMIGDYISPDEMRLRDSDGQKLDKDGFRAGASPEEVKNTYNLAVGRFRELMPKYGRFDCELPKLTKI